MARWVLKCDNCNFEFTHSTITDQSAESYYLPQRPVFAEADVLRQNSIRTENSAIPCRNRCPIGVIPSSPERQDSLPGEPPRGVPVYIKDEGTRTFFATLRWFGLGSPIVPVV